MRDTPHTTVSYREQYTVGGMLVYAALAPAVVAVLAAPALALAFIGGVVTALVVGRLGDRPGGTAAGTDGSAETGRVYTTDR